MLDHQLGQRYVLNNSLTFTVHTLKHCYKVILEAPIPDSVEVLTVLSSFQAVVLICIL